MMRAVHVLLLLYIVVLCGAAGVAARHAHRHHGGHHPRSAPAPVPVRPSSDRKSVPMTFVHVTDVHGWVFGDRHEPKADFGDFVSMVEHMKKRYADIGEELFFIDSGDLVDGTGLSDSTPVHGADIFPVVSRIPYDALTVGNHDLGHNPTVELMMEPGGFVESWGGRYLTANAFYAKPGAPRFNKTMGAPYRVVTTAAGTRILYLGFIYNFALNGNMSRVATVEETVQQPWFAEALATPALDLIVLTAHIDPDSHPELQDIQAAIRAVHPTKPLAMFVGHRHQLVFHRYDTNTFALESGKYFEHLGVARLVLDPASGALASLEHEWVQTSHGNLVRMAGVAERDFLTAGGRALKAQMTAMYNALHLQDVFGCAPRTYDPYALMTQPDSLFALYVNEIVPRLVLEPRNTTQFFITNTESLRTKLYAGRVTRNDIYSVCPFNDTYAGYNGVKGADVAAMIKAIDNMHKHEVARGCHQSPDDNELPLVVTSNIKLKPDGVYDIVTQHYDAEVMASFWKKMGKADEYKMAVYPTSINNTDALAMYVERFMPCPKGAGEGAPENVV